MRHIPVSLVVLVAAASLFPAPAHSRPQYLKNFKNAYTKIPGALNCGVCHGNGGKDKTKLTRYAKDLADSLGVKNERAPNKILDALRDTESKPAMPGKTWGDFLNNGLLPPP